MMNSVVCTAQFVAPHFIPELGEDGLTLHEVSKSLGIEFKHAKESLEKNLSDYSTVEISAIANKGFAGTKEVRSYALTVDDAKFFVAGYNNEIGKAYRRFLIECEKVVNKVKDELIQAGEPEDCDSGCAQEVLSYLQGVLAGLEAATETLCKKRGEYLNKQQAGVLWPSVRRLDGRNLRRLVTLSQEMGYPILKDRFHKFVWEEFTEEFAKGLVCVG